METATHQHPQPRPILGACFPQIFLAAQRVRFLETYDRASLSLLKYYPKNIHSLPSELYHRNVKARTKRLKLIKTIPNDHSNKTLRVLTGNKGKNVKLALSVRDFDCGRRYHKENFQLLKMFPNVQKVEFGVLNHYFVDEQQQRSQAKRLYWVNRMSNYLNGMANLKHLKLSNRGFNLLPLLSKLNSFEKMLSRLEVFKLDFGLTSFNDFPDLQALLGYKTVLKNLTCLKLNLLEEEEFFPVFQLLPGLCPRLLSLFSSFNQRQTFWTYDEISFLKCLQGFQNLQRLSLCCENKLDAFRYCKFPKSLRFLDLYFVSREWQTLINQEAFDDKQEGLENLESLQIFLYSYNPIEDEEIIKDFIKNLLSRIFVLKEFKIELYPHIQGERPSYPFDLSRFLSCFRHLSHSLQGLTINDRSGKYSFTNFLDTQDCHFPELSYLLKQGGTLSSIPEIENIIQLVQAPAPQVKFERIKIESWKLFLELLNSLKKVSGKNIELAMFYRRMQEDSDDDNEDYFKENYEQVKRESRNLRNVTLHIKFSAGWPKFRGIKELRSLENLFRKLTLTEHVYLDDE